MAVPAKVEEVYSALEESARLVDVPCSRDKVWPILTAYADGLVDATLVVFSMAAGERHRGDLDYNFTVPSGGDPYAVALSKGFTAETDHPVAALLSDLHQRCPVHVFGVECGAVSGFKKTYVFFPLDGLQELSKLVDIPSMPPAVAEHAGTFARYGVDKVSIIGIDYVRRTMNVYFGGLSPECVEAENVRSLLRDIGLPAPSEQMLTFIQKSFSIYPTFSWDSSKIERICFSIVTPDAEALPARLEPEIGKFARSAPYAYPGDRILVYGATLSPGEEYYKLGCYYQKPPEMWSKWRLADQVVDRA
jgi:Aromatic prenyltransferase Orf2